MPDGKSGLSQYVMADHLIHGKTDNGEEVILFPYTRYENVLGSPKVITDMNAFPGAPFFFYVTDEVDVDETVLQNMIGIPFTN